MSRITRVIIEGARAFERLELDLGGLTVLIGRNGSGKSTVMECLQLLSACAQESFHSQLRSLLPSPEAA